MNDKHAPSLTAASLEYCSQTNSSKERSTGEMTDSATLGEYWESYPPAEEFVTNIR